MARVFLSHSRRDNRHAIALKRWLEQAEPGLAGEIYLDVDPETGIRTGMRWTEALWQVNARCEAVICLLSGNWATSAECHAEYRQAEGMHKPIFCARIEDFTDNDVTRAWQSCDLFGDGPAVDVALDDEPPVRLQVDGLNRLLAGLREVGVGADSFVWPPPGDPDRSPYRGWQPLQAQDAAVYFGRDAQIVGALDELREMRATGLERMFVILGTSGVGKSSFLRAGLLPRLRRDDRRFLTMPAVRPQRRALSGETGLARSIHDLRREVGLNGPSLGEIKNAVADYGTARAWLLEAAFAAGDRFLATSAGTRPPTLVLPLDQAEELFGVDAGEEGQAFLELLGRLLSDVGSARLDVIAVVTIRSDRYAPLQTAAQLSAVQSHLFDRLKAMPHAQFAEVICGPARRAAESGSRCDFAPELVDRLAQDASVGADTLPLLALTLSRLYDDYAGSEAAIGISCYEAMGGMCRVVQNEIDTLLSANTEERAEQLGRLHDAFIPWLATVNSETDQPMRRIARWTDLPEDSHELVNAFVAQRLLVKGERDGQIVVEVALESLLHQWEELAEWLRTEGADLREVDALERAVVAWERNDRHGDWLLDGARLAAAETMSTRKGFAARLNPAGEFLLASRRRANQKLNDDKLAAEAYARSLRRRSQVLTALLAVIAVVATFAVISRQRAAEAEETARNQADRATAAKLILESRAMVAGTQLGGDRRAILQMAAAEALAPQSDPASLLNTLIDASRLVRVFSLPSPVSGMDVSPDGRHVASAGDDGIIRQWDLATGAPVGEPLTGHNENARAGVMYTRNGSWIASSADGTMRIWDANTGATVHVLKKQRGDSLSTISPDGRLIAEGYRDGTIQLSEVATGSPTGAPIPAHDRVLAIAFSPDGSRLATGGADGTLRLWNVGDGRPGGGPPLPSHRGPIMDVEFSRDSQRIASLSYLVGTDPTDAPTAADGTGITTDGMQLRVTEASTGHPIVDGVTEFGYGVNDLEFSPDGRRVAVGTADGTVRVRDADTGAKVGQPLRGHTEAVIRVAYSTDDTDGTHIISAGDNTIHVWAAEPNRTIGDWLPGPVIEGAQLPAAVSPDDQTVATRDFENQSDIAIWQIGTRERTRTIQTGHDGPVTALAWRADGEVIASAGGADNTVRIWDAHTGASAGPTLSGPPAPTIGLSYSPDGHRLAATVLRSDPWLWDLVASPPRGMVLPVDEDIVNVVFSAAGHRLLAVSPMHFITNDDTVDDMIKATGNVFHAPKATPSAVRVWNADTGEPAGSPLTHPGGNPMDIAVQDGDGPLFAAALTPDGQRMVVSTAKGLRLHDLTTGEPVGEPWLTDPSGRSGIIKLSFSPDGRYVVSADAGTADLQLWDARTGLSIGNPLVGQASSVDRLAFTADGNHIVSGGADGWILWPGPNSWRDALCEKLTANMSPAEWAEWVSPNIDYRVACPSLPVPE